MDPLFLFGTLQHRPLMEAVLGVCNHLELKPAHLAGHSVYAVAEGPFPMITPDLAGVVEGRLVTGLTAEDAAKLDYYEAAFDYSLERVKLTDGSVARCYFPAPGAWTPQGAWSLEAWAETAGPMSILAAQDVMTYYGSKTPQEIGTMFPMIRARAWSRLNAQHSLHGQGTLFGRVDVVARQRPYASYFALDEYNLRHERFDGSMTDEVKRAVFLAPDATLVLPYDPIRDRVLLVEQMRMGPLARGDRAVWQLEPVAGRLDPGEAPQTAARREALEEAGLHMGDLEPVAQTYCSPGNSTEFYYIFVGHADLPDAVQGVGGLDAEDEDIKSHLISFEDLMTLCDRQEVANAPLVMVSYWLARHRDRLRYAWTSPPS